MSVSRASSSGHSEGGGGDSPASNQSAVSSASEKCGKYSLEGLAEKWDNDSFIRDRLRDGGFLLQHWDTKLQQATNTYCERNMANLKLNAQVISPVLGFMAQNDQLCPMIDHVLEQVKKLFTKSKSTFDADRVYQEGWAIRRLLSLTKSLMWKDKFPKDHGFQVCSFNIICFKTQQVQK